MIPFRTRPTLLVCALSLAACGGDGDGGAPATSDVALRFSDAPVEALDSVTITVDTVTFRRDNGEDIVVESFTSEELGLVDADSFTIDLLDVQGEDSRLVLDSVELPVGGYSDLRLGILDEDLNFSYVEESADGALKPIKVPSDELKLGAFEVTAQSTQAFVVEFGLRQSMTYNPGPDRYNPQAARRAHRGARGGGDDRGRGGPRRPCTCRRRATRSRTRASATRSTSTQGGGLDTAALADDFDSGGRRGRGGRAGRAAGLIHGRGRTGRS